MSRNIWFISDTHFGHKNIIKFLKSDGTPIRPRPGTNEPFSCIEEHDQLLVDNWNGLINNGDKVYCLGDFGNPEFGFRLAGEKRLILGNHDHKWDVLLKVFGKIMLNTYLKHFKVPETEFNAIFTHMPTNSEADHAHRMVDFNVHGHIHEKMLPNPHYINLCVENTSMKPVHLDELLKIMESRQ